MARPHVDPLRTLIEEERVWLTRLSRARAEPAAHVARATALLAVADGASYTDAAHTAGRRSGDAVAQLVARFNREGLAALAPRHGGGHTPVYDASAQVRILAEARRTPDPATDGTATWSLTTLQGALRRAPDGLPHVSTYTIWQALHTAGLSWQHDRSWLYHGARHAQAGVGAGRGHRRGRRPQKDLIEAAYTTGEAEGLAVWTEDEAGPFQTIPVPGQQWQPEAEPARYPHEHIRDGTAKLLTLFHPRTGTVRVHGVPSCTNVVLHEWLEAQLAAILATLPTPVVLSPEENRARWARWARWQRELRWPFTLATELPPLRMLLVLDNLTGHKTPPFVCWLMAHGIMPLYTPLGGSWLNIAYFGDADQSFRSKAITQFAPSRSGVSLEADHHGRA